LLFPKSAGGAKAAGIIINTGKRLKAKGSRDTSLLPLAVFLSP